MSYLLLEDSNRQQPAKHAVREDTRQPVLSNAKPSFQENFAKYKKASMEYSSRLNFSQHSSTQMMFDSQYIQQNFPYPYNAKLSVQQKQDNNSWIQAKLKKQGVVRQYATNIVSILLPFTKIQSKEGDNSVYSASSIESYLKIYSYLSAAVQTFKRSAEKHVNQVISSKKQQNWLGEFKKRFEDQYKYNVPQQTTVERIVQVFYDQFRNLIFIQRILSSGYQQQLLQYYFIFVEEIRDSALETLLSKNNALKLKAILACHSQLSHKLQKVVQGVDRDLEHWISEKARYLQQYANQIFITIQNGLKDIVKAALNALQVAQVPLPKVQEEAEVKAFIKEYPSLNKLQTQINAKMYIVVIKKYCRAAAESVDSFLKQKVVEKLMRVAEKWSNEDFRKQIEQGIFRKLQALEMTIAFGFTEGVYAKEYQEWFRGRSQNEKAHLYNKHLNLINYLSLVRPASVVNYYRTEESPQQKKFYFFMQKGDRSFINFEGGYKFYTNLTQKQKIRYVMDICESLIQLQYHGITHNDITFRNTIKVKDRYKLIDFDVARMVNFSVDLSGFAEPEQQVIQKCRQNIIASSMALYRSELEEDEITARTDPKKAPIAVQNINRLAQYYLMRNDNPMRLLIESKIKEQNKWLKQNQKIRLLNSYQKLVVGKADCNKFGFMLLKLMHYSSYFHQPTIEADVHVLIKEYYTKPLGKINFRDYLRKFRFSPETPLQTNQQLLKLIGKLMQPSLSKRIPMLLFALQFLQIFNIKEYSLQIDGQSFVGRDKAYDWFVKQYPNRLVEANQSQRLLRELIEDHEHRDVGQIRKVFLQTLQDAKEHKSQIYSLLKFRKLNLGRPFDFELLKVDKNQKKTLNTVFSLLTEKVRYIYRDVFRQLGRQFKEFICYTHLYPIVAFCGESTCRKVWLCKVCLRDCYSQIDEENRFAELDHTDYSQSETRYHKILHLHSKSEIICLARLQTEQWFGCRQCGDKIFRFDQLLQLKRIQPQKRMLLDRICLEKQCRQNPYLMNRVKSQHKLATKILYRQMMIKAMISVKQVRKHKMKLFNESIQAVRKQLNAWAANVISGIQAVSNIISSQQSIVVAKGIQSATRGLPYLPSLLQNQKQLNETRQYLKMINNPRVKIENVFDAGDYIGHKIKHVFKQIIQKIQRKIAQKKINREAISITNEELAKLYKQASNKASYEITSEIDRIKKPNFVQEWEKRSYEEERGKEQSKFQLWKDKKHSRFNQCDSNSIILSISSMKKIFSQIEIQPFEWICQHAEKQEKNHNKVKYFCLYENCQKPFFCQNCRSSDSHEEKMDLANYEFNIKIAQKEEEGFFNLEKLDQDIQKDFQESQFKYFLDIKSEVAQKIEFLESVIITGNKNDEEAYKITYQMLKQAFQTGDQCKYAQYIFLINEIANNLQDFMHRTSFSFDRYIKVLNQITEDIQQGVSSMKMITLHDWKSINNDAQTMKQYFKQKYKHVVITKQTFHKKFSTIPARNAIYCHILQINGLEEVKSQEGPTQEKKIIEFNQLKKKMLRSGFNSFSINYFLSCFQIQTRFNFDKIASFTNLQILKIIDKPNVDQPLYLKSTTLQCIIANAKLKELVLQCFNGFDLYCLKLLKSQASHQIKLSVKSYRELGIELQHLAYIFDQNKINFTPFMIHGELIQLGDYFQSKNLTINAAEYQINLSPNHQHLFEQTVRENYDSGSIIYMNQSVTANYLSIIFNQFHGEEHLRRQESPFDLTGLMQHFLYKVYIEQNHTTAFLTSLTEIQQRMYGLTTKFNLLAEKYIFKNVVFLDLYGIVLEKTAHQQFGSFVNSFQHFLEKQPFLQSLRIKDSFGVDVKSILKTMKKLKRLVLQNVFFAGYIDQIGQTESKLQVIAIKSARVIGRSINDDFAHLLTKFMLKQLRMLILNDCYSLQNAFFDFLVPSKLQYLSIRRCFRITKSFLFFLKQIKTLKAVDVSYTQITQKDFKTEDLSWVKVIQRNWQNQPKQQDLEQINRIALRYNLKDILHGHSSEAFLYDLNNFNQIRFVKQVFEEKRLFDSLNPLLKLPNVYILQFYKCIWRQINHFGEIQFHNMMSFPFFKRFQKLKQLILIGCGLKTINQKELKSYKYLRSLVLKHNQLESIGELQFQQLIQLDLSHNYIEKVSLNSAKLPKLQKLNLISNSLKEIPQSIYELYKLRILLADQDVKQDFLRNEDSLGENNSKIILKGQGPIPFQRKLQQICYLFKTDQQLQYSTNWHVKLIKFNIQKDIKKGTGMIIPQTEDNYNFHFASHPLQSTAAKERVKQNWEFQMRLLLRAQAKTKVIYNEQFFKNQGFLEREDFHMRTNHFFKQLAYKTARYYSKKQNNMNYHPQAHSKRQSLPDWCCRQIEYVAQYDDKSNYNFALLCAKGETYKSTEEVVLKKKALPFFLCYLKIAKMLRSDNKLHIGLKQSSFIDYSKQAKSDQLSFKLLDVALLLHLSPKSKQKGQDATQNYIYHKNNDLLKRLLEFSTSIQRVQYIKRLLVPHVVVTRKPIDAKASEDIGKSLNQRLQKIGKLLLNWRLSKDKEKNLENATKQLFNLLRKYMVVSYEFQILNCASVLVQMLQNMRNLASSKQMSKKIKQLWQSQYTNTI